MRIVLLFDLEYTPKSIGQWSLEIVEYFGILVPPMKIMHAGFGDDLSAVLRPLTISLRTRRIGRLEAVRIRTRGWVWSTDTCGRIPVTSGKDYVLQALETRTMPSTREIIAS
ncbi:unnamed protein product [Bursaphelenchus xylophilus]|uniref:(pine wood nematode) hypothetical protein n=1 Tax=Bursaphelenchus xylophilus TaxID=6326 RepID=A0A811LX85_BURXY|nr:unnamed protein product [Bursaphelenchus xylophilus]CAG9122468.1 unnamed protein product [Bursaphelenchus xylophilus]